jgi:molybdopterin molybdotransferase
MRPFTSTISFDEALRRVLGAAQPIERVEELALAGADGRVAAADIHATVDVPAFDRSAMDGYAVVAADTTGAGADRPRELVCVGRVFTGQISPRPVGPGQCIEIATGAPLPAGADAVVMVEETETGIDGSIRIMRAAKPRQNVGARAADFAEGDRIIRGGQLLTPARLGALSATGLTCVSVYAKPRVGLISTGDEVVDPGEPLAPGQVYNVNRITMQAVVRRHGGEAIVLPTAGDSLEALGEVLDARGRCDVLVFSGGSSVGERDLVLDVLRDRGQVEFHGIAVKPGKPTAFGHIGPTPVFGMPGNPTACLSNAYLLLAPFLRRLARLPEWRPHVVDAPLARRIVSTTGRHQFYTVRVIDGLVEPAFKASGDITSMANADGYVEIPARTDVVEAGTVMTVKLFEF